VSNRKLDEIPTVVIDEIGGYKFILARVSDGAGNEKLVVRACDKPELDYHWKLVRALAHESKVLYVECLGGGRISVDPTKKTIRLWDSSGDYGLEPRQETVKLLKTEFPDFEVIA